VTTVPAPSGCHPHPGQVAEAPPERALGITWRQAASTLTSTLFVFVLAGAVGAWVWAATTSTPAYRVRSEGVLLEAAGYPAFFDADAGFFVIGLAVAIVTGAALAAVFYRSGIVTVLAVLLGSALACWTMKYLGITLGPDPVADQVATAQAGDLLSSPLGVRASGVLFAWPIGALVGGFAAFLLFDRPKPQSAEPPVG
jgi:hypothetical protein